MLSTITKKGDGTNAMAIFDKTQSVEVRSSKRIDNAVGGTESKKTQKNVWGFSTGYANELAEKGMTDVDEYGEDQGRTRVILESLKGARFDTISEQKCDETKPTRPLTASEWNFWSKRLCDRHSSSGISFSKTLVWPRC